MSSLYASFRVIAPGRVSRRVIVRAAIAGCWKRLGAGVPARVGQPRRAPGLSRPGARTVVRLSRPGVLTLSGSRGSLSAPAAGRSRGWRDRCRLGSDMRALRFGGGGGMGGLLGIIAKKSRTTSVWMMYDCFHEWTEDALAGRKFQELIK